MEIFFAIFSILLPFLVQISQETEGTPAFSTWLCQGPGGSTMLSFQSAGPALMYIHENFMGAPGAFAHPHSGPGRLCTPVNSIAETMTAMLPFVSECGPLEARNKKVVLGFMHEVLGYGDVDAADKYVSENYIQHNPQIGDGRAAVKKILGLILKDKKKEPLDIRRIIAHGDYVWAHYRAVWGKPMAVVDIFRVDRQSGLLAEHWDIAQEVPATAANNNTMF